jgi:hypothetical protein
MDLNTSQVPAKRRAQIRVSALPRNEHDRYFTPSKLTDALARHVPAGTLFYEPCVGDGSLINHLAVHEIHCIGASDIAPLKGFNQRNLFDVRETHIVSVDCFITNPPYGDPGNPRSRKQMRAMIAHMLALRPTWVLLHLDFAANVSSRPLMRQCSDIVSVGRWRDPGTKSGGYFNFAWFRFQREPPALTVFHAG